MTDRCAIPRCRAEVEIVYLGHGVCDRHWNEFTAEDVSPDALRMVLGIEVEAAARETDMTAKRKTETTAAEQAAQPEAPAKKAKAPRKRKAATKPKKAGEAETAKESKSKAEKPGRVFAIRLTDEELAAIHRAAGPRNATRFIRAVASAFANEDEAAFKSVLKKAQEARA